MFEISIKASFSSAHHLRGYAGACRRPHGHNWEVEVFLRAAELDDAGMLMDFHQVKETVRETLQTLDHRDLNELAEFAQSNPTSEQIACYLYRELTGRLNADGRRVVRVRVSETATTSAVYWEGPADG